MLVDEVPTRSDPATIGRCEFTGEREGSSTRLSRNARPSRWAFGKSSTPTAIALATTAPNSDGRVPTQSVRAF
jgi:hypothetical protein